MQPARQNWEPERVPPSEPAKVALVTKTKEQPNGQRWPRPGTVAYAERRGVLELLQEVCARNGATVEEMLGKRRRRHLSWARGEAAYLLHRRFSWPVVADILGMKDHTSPRAGALKFAERARLASSAEQRADNDDGGDGSGNE